MTSHNVHVRHLTKEPLTHGHHNTFLVRFQKNLLLEISKALLVLRTFFVFVSSIVYGALLFLFDFDIVKDVFWFLFPYLAFYVIGLYLTLLPMYVVIILIFLPTRIKWPILSLAVFFSFFIVFLV